MSKSEWCPQCGSPETGPVLGLGPPSPGDRIDYVCSDCGHAYSVVVPEPLDGYEGDGVYADNH
jgi:transposase-like protein